MSDPEKTVFISYRRSVSSFIARAVFQDLRYNGFDVFMDVESIDSGAFDTIILNQIAARTHFLIVLTPGAVERCAEPGDWLRREIEHAMSLKRNIIPLMVNDFNFAQAAPYLVGNLSDLSRYNAVKVSHDYFEEAMIRLRTRFLKLDAAKVELQAVSTNEQQVVQQKIEIAESQPLPSETQLSSEQLYDRGHQKWEEKDYKGAILDCDEAVRLNPEFAEAYNRRGTAYMGLSEYEAAITDFQIALRLNPVFTAAHYNLGLAQAAQGKHDAAMKHYNEALRVNPLFPLAYYSRAVARTAKGDYRGANNDYFKYLDLGGGEQYGNRAEVERTMQSLKDKWHR